MEGWLQILSTIVVTGCGFFYATGSIKGTFGARIDEHERRLNHIEEDVVWKDSCGPRHDEVNRRLDRVERTQNGKG